MNIARFNKKNISFVFALFAPMFFSLNRIDVNPIFLIILFSIFSIILLTSLIFFNRIKKSKPNEKPFEGIVAKVLFILFFCALLLLNVLSWISNYLEISKINSILNLTLIVSNFIYLILQTTTIIFLFYLTGKGKLVD